MEQAFEWIARIIESCRDDFHLTGAMKLIDFFKEVHGESISYHELLKKHSDKEAMIMIR